MKFTIDVDFRTVLLVVGIAAVSAMAFGVYMYFIERATAAYHIIIDSALTNSEFRLLMFAVFWLFFFVLSSVWMVVYKRAREKKGM